MPANLTERRADDVHHIVVPPHLDVRSAQRLVDVCAELAEDRTVRVVLVEPEADELATSGDAHLVGTYWLTNPCEALADLRAPVVCDLGSRVGRFGLELALACDVRVARPDCVMSLPDVTAGETFVWGGTQRLCRSISAGRAIGMLWLRTEIAADEALSAGLVHQIGTATEIVERLGRLAPLALELSKEAVWRGTELPLPDALRLEGDLNTLLQDTDDRAEGLAAFFEKRRPIFRGR